MFFIKFSLLFVLPIGISAVKKRGRGKKIVTRMVLPSFLHLFGKRWGINGWREIGG